MTNTSTSSTFSFTDRVYVTEKVILAFEMLFVKAVISELLDRLQ